MKIYIFKFNLLDHCIEFLPFDNYGRGVTKTKHSVACMHSKRKNESTEGTCYDLRATWPLCIYD